MRSLLRHCLVVSLLVTGLTVAIAAVPATAANGTITGTVYRTGGVAVPGAYVYASALDGSRTYSAIANGSGGYSVPVPPGDYCVSFAPESGVTTRVTYPNQKSCLDHALPVPVTAGGTTAGISPTMHLSTVTGVVRTVANAPVSGAAVYGSRLDGDEAGDVSTDANGVYTLPDVLPGTYCLRAQTNTASALNVATPACPVGTRLTTVGVDATLTGIDFTIGTPPPEFGGAIAGHVTNANGGAPLSGRSVVAKYTNGEFAGSTQSAADGSYTISDLAPGQYCVFTTVVGNQAPAAETYLHRSSCGDNPTLVTVGTTTAIGIDLALGTGGSISGQVTKPTGGGVLAQLTIIDMDEDFNQATVMTDSSGNYQVSGLPSGHYCVAAVDLTNTYAKQAYLHAPNCRTNPTPVAVTQGSATTGINIALAVGGKIGGTITFPPSIANISATITILDGSAYFPYVNVTANGPYLSTPLPAGTYCMLVRSGYSPFLAQPTFGYASGTCATKPIVVTDNAVTTVNITVPLGGTISGFMLNPDGRPVPQGRYPSSSAPTGETNLAFDGAYVLTNLPTGNYCVMARSNAVYAVPLVYKSGFSCSNGATLVPVTAGANTPNINLEYTSAGTVTGEVRVPLGATFTGAVEFRRTDAAQEAITVEVADDSGGVRPVVYSGSVPPGTYCVLATSDGTGAVGSRAYGGTSGCDGATPVVVPVNQTVRSIDITLPRQIFLPLAAPQRLVDTRPDGTTVDGIEQRGGPVAGGTVREVTVGGRAGVPADASTAALNVTVTNPAAAGFLTVFPCGSTKPLASSLNYVGAQTVPNLVVTKLGTAGKVCVFTNVTTDIVVDVAGYFPTTAGFTPLAVPQRLVDTRPDGTTIDGAEQRAGSLKGGTVREVTVNGRAGVPGTASTAALNVTVTGPVASGFLTVFPCGSPQPLASNLNFVAGQTVPNFVVAKVGTGGKVCVVGNVATDIIVDVAGYFGATDGLTPLAAPQRLVDTRPDGTTADGAEQRGGAVLGGSVREVTVRGRAGVPIGAVSAALNVTATGPVASGFLTVFPCGSPQPLASNLNFVAGQTVPNSVVSKLGTSGKVCVFTNVTTDVVVDVAGYFSG